MRCASRWAEFAAFVAVVTLAIWVRLPGDPPALLWLDEAWRVRQSLEGGAYGVLLPSEHLFVRLGYLFFGLNAAAFRVWPILGIILAMSAAARLGGLLFRTPLWLWVCLTYALAESFAMHTREFKPYGMDLGLTMATVAIVVSAARGDGRSLKWCMVASSLTAAGSAIFPFVHAGTSLFLLTRRRFPMGQLAMAIVVPLAVFCIVYFGYVGREPGMASTTKFWAGLYVDSVKNLRLVADVAWKTGDDYSLVGPLALWSCTFVLAPIASLWRRDGLWVLLLGPFLAQLAFSALGRYPLFDRPSFYFYGLAALAVPYCADVLVGVVKQERARTLIAWGLLALGAVWLVVSGRAGEHWENGRRWPLRPDARPVFETLARDYDSSAPLFLNQGIAHTFVLHAPEFFPPGSPLLSQGRDWKEAMRNHNLTELCAQMMLRAGNLQAGQTAWFASAHTGYAARYYEELLRRVGKVEILVDERAACLVRVRLDAPMGKLRPLCQQLWDRAHPK